MDKLSVKAPDGPTKIKLLKEIAAEHNVTWEADSLVESDRKETVLSVSNLHFQFNVFDRHNLASLWCQLHLPLSLLSVSSEWSNFFSVSDWNKLGIFKNPKHSTSRDRQCAAELICS